MLFAEVFFAIIFIVLAIGIIRAMYRKWRRASVSGRMREIEEDSKSVEEIREFERSHKTAAGDRRKIDEFTKGR